MRVADLTWQQYTDVVGERVVVLPMGAVDAHGPHLPLSADTIISTYLAQELERRVDVLVLPAIPYGQKTDPPASGGQWPGVTDLRGSTLTAVVLDVLRASYRHGARRFLLLDAHKVNIGPVREAADLFVEAAPGARIMAAVWWDLVSEDSRNAIAAETGVSRRDDHHAAMVETSLVMHIAPDAVREHLLGDDEPARRARYLVLPVPEDLQTRTGVVYRASRARADIGARLLEEIVATLVEAVELELGQV